MATIKRNGDKVVLKDGKVACGCCEIGCCMYPAQALFDGLYTVDDLPDELLVKIPESPDTIAYKTGSSYFGSNGVEISLVQNSENPELYQWKIDPAGLEVSCLIDVFVEDQFADSYTLAYIITDENIGSTTITRQSLCVWTGNAGGVPVRLEYEDTDFFRWFMITPETEIQKGEPAFQNTPTGFYETGNIEFTVS